MKTVVITGGSSGIGAATAAAFAKSGYRVYEFSRKPGTPQPGVSHVTADVTQEDSVRNAFARVWEQEGRLDVLINNAGFGISGPVETTDLEQAKRQFDVNFFGTFLCAKCAAGYMRKTGGGKIVNISSMAAPLPIPFQAFYSASKAAVNSLTLSLANELRPFGISVCAVMPGDVKTGFTAAREKSQSADSAYAQRLARSVESMEKDEQNGMTPDSIARAVLACAEKRSPRPLSAVGIPYHLAAAAAKVLPVRAVNRVLGILYAK